MCKAVAACHDVGVFHQDIEPQYFIVADGWATSMHPDSEENSLNKDFSRERRVNVKLADFGLSRCLTLAHLLYGYKNLVTCMHVNIVDFAE